MFLKGFHLVSFIFVWFRLTSKTDANGDVSCLAYTQKNTPRTNSAGCISEKHYLSNLYHI